MTTNTPAPPTRRSLKAQRRAGAGLLGSGAIAAVIALVMGMMALGGVTAGSAQADPGATAVLNGTDPGYQMNVTLKSGARKDVGPEIMYLHMGTQTLAAYCIQLEVFATDGGVYTEAAWSETAVKNEANVQWILKNSYPVISAQEMLTKAGISTTGMTTYTMQTVALSATQAAIWHYTDGATLNKVYNSLHGAKVMTAYQWLVGHATAGATATPVTPSISIPANATLHNGVIGPVTVTTSNGSAAAVTVTPAAAAKYLDGTDVDFKAVRSGVAFSFVNVGTSGSLTLTATGTGSISAGRVWVLPGSQTLVMTGDSVIVTRTTTAVITWTGSTTSSSATSGSSTSTATSTTSVPTTSNPDNPCDTPTATSPSSSSTAPSPTAPGDCDDTPTTPVPTTTNPDNPCDTPTGTPTTEPGGHDGDNPGDGDCDETPTAPAPTTTSPSPLPHTDAPNPSTPSVPDVTITPAPAPAPQPGTPDGPLAQTGTATGAIGGTALMLMGAGLLLLAMTRGRRAEA